MRNDEVGNVATSQRIILYIGYLSLFSQLLKTWQTQIAPSCE